MNGGKAQTVILSQPCLKASSFHAMESGTGYNHKDGKLCVHPGGEVRGLHVDDPSP